MNGHLLAACFGSTLGSFYLAVAYIMTSANYCGLEASAITNNITHCFYEIAGSTLNMEMVGACPWTDVFGR